MPIARRTGVVVPDRMWVSAPGVSTSDCRHLAALCASRAQSIAPKVSGAGARGIKPISGDGFFGISWDQTHLWYVEQGTAARTMRSLAGKAQPLSEPVLTPSGWKKMGELAVGDHAVGSDGCPTMILGIFPQGEMECWKVTFSDGTSVRCSSDHLWGVYRDGNTTAYSKSLKVRTTTELIAGMSSGRRVWSVPMHAPVVGQVGPSLPLDPYLLGIMISEGCRGSSPTFAQDQMPVVDEVRKVLPADVSLYPNNPSPGSGKSWRMVAGGRGTTTNPIARALRELGMSPSQDSSSDVRVCPECGSTGTRRGEFTSSRAVLIHSSKVHGTSTPRPLNRIYGVYSYEKFIPAPVFALSVQDRLSVLQGLMDGDGSCPTQGAMKYHTSSPWLATDVVELIRSLGGRAKSAEDRQIRSKAKHTMHTVYFRVPTDMLPFRAELPKKLHRYESMNRYDLRTKRILSIEPDGVEEMQCISVASSDSLYVTTGHTLTHNTIPMWLPDPLGRLHRENPKNKTRVTVDGRQEVLFFRKVAKIGQTKNAIRRDSHGRLQVRSVPASYPGAAGRINLRQFPDFPGGTGNGRIMSTIERPHVGVRWRHPGIVGKHFMAHSITTVCQEYGITASRINATFRKQ
jgi:hypothetical protein